MNFCFPKINWNLVLRMMLIGILCGITITPIQSQQSKVDSLSKLIHKNSLKKGFFEKDTVHINTLIKLGKSYRYVNSDSLLQIAKKSLKLSKASDFKYGIIGAHSLYGDYYSDKGKSANAIDNYERALKIVEVEMNKNQKLDLLNSLAGEYGYLGDYSKALSGYLKGIDLATEVNNKSLLSIMNENIANLYTSQKDFKQALEFYEKVIAINEDIGNEIFAAETFSNIASTYSKMKKFDYAMFNVNKSISTFEKHQILDWLAYAYEVKGRIYLEQNKHKWALYWYEQSNLIHTKIDDERGKIDMLNGISQTYLSLEKDSLAMAYAESGFKVAKNINSLEGQKECANTLYKICKRNSDFTNALLYHELHKKLSDSLSRDDNKKSLSLLKAKLDYEKQKELLIEKTEKTLARQRIIIYSSLGILLILGVIIFIVVRSQKIQKRLNKKLNHKTRLIRKREIQLSELNKTKNKLFSIIGHDLRGPIGALQDLLHLFSNGDIKRNELDSFIPKLKSDVDNVFFTLNNLLSWGQSQMNGSSTKPKNFSIASLIDSNINLLSEMALNKSIKMLNHVEDTPIAWADQNQIDIVIRNLLSNALKFTSENGLISISAIENGNFWEIQIKDTGVGMTKDMQEKILSANSTTTTYGTNNEKGTGLGLSLCREMVEKNNGKIWVDSIINKGSIFSFTIPKEKSSYKKAG
ncbi:ATP-binding protein [uncultured Croceitalea sp.]|uniref:tetratricopeptide repeat-containing sensor histidine kinase n=1 Tax=uncultured Croceitalea sp. TaxID=1798908 RepID=UPI00330681EA